jgi:DNA-binding transcriptional ArsR family regulator
MVMGHDTEELLGLDPDEVALIALPWLKEKGEVCWNNLNQDSRAEMNRDGVTDEETIRRVSWKRAAAWHWLLNEGSLAPHPGQITPGTWPQNERLRWQNH